MFYSYDESDKKHLSADPLIPDPYEHQYVYVAKSTLSNAGEGLFAKKTLPKDVRGILIIKIYNVL